VNTVVVKRTPLATEVALGYLLRLSEANGYPCGTWLPLVVLPDTMKVSKASFDTKKFAALTGLSTDQSERMCFQSNVRPRKITNFLGHDLAVRDLLFSRPKVCPGCLAESTACEAFWDLTLVTACPRHRIRLLDTCESCSEPLKWNRSKTWQCPCGADLRNQGCREPVSEELAELMAALRATLYCDRGIQVFPASLSSLESLGLFGMCTLISVIAEVVKYPMDRAGDLTRSRFKLAPQMDAVAHVLRDWPHNFRRFLDETYGPVLTGNIVPSFTTLFSWARLRLHSSLRKRGIDDTFIMKEVYRFAAMHWSREKLVYKGDDESLIPDVPNWTSLDEAARITRLRAVTIKGLMVAGIAPFKLITECRDRRNIMVDLRWVRSKLPSTSPSTHVLRASKLLGFSIKTVQQLREQGILPDRHHVQHKNGYAMEDIKAFREQLHALGRRILGSVPPEATTLLRTFGVTVVGAQQRAALIKAMLDGEVEILGRVGNDPHHLVLSSLSVQQFLERTAQEPLEPSVSRQKAKQILGGTYRSIRGLVDAGYLQLVERPNWDEISLASLRAFDSQYVTVSRFCDETGMIPITVRMMARRLGVDLIAVKSRPSRTGLLRRRDLSVLRKHAQYLKALDTGGGSEHARHVTSA